MFNAIVWQDKRTADICEKWKSDGLNDAVRQKTGLLIDSYFSASKIRWLIDNANDIQEELSKGNILFGTVDSWLIWKMTNGQSHVTDRTNASRTMLFNIEDGIWDQDLLKAFDIPSSILPNVLPSMSHFGNFNYQGCEIPILGVAGDQQAALFGQGCFEKGQAKNTYGTGCFMLMQTGHELIRSTKGLLTTIAASGAGPIEYALEGSVFVAGSVVQWLRDELNFVTQASESEKMAMSVRDNYDVFVVPAFVGLGAPYWDMYARGAMFGLTRATKIEHIVKASLESLCYQTRDVIDLMQSEAEIDMTVLKVDGGASANAYLCQFQSDILQNEIERPVNVESTAMGAAYLAGIQAGIWKKQDVLDNRAVDITFTPQMKQDFTERLYSKWKDAVGRSLHWIDN